MAADLSELSAFVAVAQAGGFRQAARGSSASASALSEGVRRLEARLGVRLLNRTTRSVAPTEAGVRMLERLMPALAEVEAALDVANAFRDRPAGVLRLNVPSGVAYPILPPILTDFLAAYPDIRVELLVEDSFVDMLAAGCDAGVRYDERLEQDMIAVPIGPRVQRFMTAAAPAYLAAHGVPQHPRDLLRHRCLRVRFAHGGAPPWEFLKGGETMRVDPSGPLIVQPANAAHVAVEAAVLGLGVTHLFEDWLRPHLDSGALVPLLEDWQESFSGPFLYFPSRRLMPAPLRAFVDFVRGR